MDFNTGPMANTRPSKKRHQVPKTVKQRQKIQFLFPDPLVSKLTEDYLVEFARKIKSEHTGRTSIVRFHQEKQPAGEAETQIHHLSLEEEVGDEFRSIFAEGYTVILEPEPLERQINPNEFLQLGLDTGTDAAVYYEVSFRGKNSIDHAGLIVPAEAVRYLVSVAGMDASLKTGLIRVILQKLGFEKREVVIHQNAPFDTTPPKRSHLWERVKLSLAWNTTFPIREARDSSVKSFSFMKENSLFRLAFFLITLAIFIVLPILSLDA
jgi:hypothetical protein